MGAGLVFGWFALTLVRLGMFCFEGEFFSGFGDPEALRPDCFVVRVNGWANPKLWLVTNLAISSVLALMAFTTAYGFFRTRRWARTIGLIGSIVGMMLFVTVAFALVEFRTLGAICTAAFGFAVLFLTVGRNAQVLPNKSLERTRGE